MLAQEKAHYVVTILKQKMNIRCKKLIVQDESYSRKNVPVNYRKLPSNVVEKLRDSAESVYFQAEAFPSNEEDVSGGSFVINLLPKKEKNEEIKNVCVSQNLTAVRFGNSGVQLHSLRIEKCTIRYIDGKEPKHLKGQNPITLIKGKDTEIPFYLAPDMEVDINITEITDSFDGALCDHALLDPEKDATKIGIKDEFFFYEEITLQVTAQSKYGETTLDVSLMQVGDRMSPVTTIVPQSILQKFCKPLKRFAKKRAN